MAVVAALVALVVSSGVALAVTRQCPLEESRTWDGCKGTEQADTLLGSNTIYQERFFGEGGPDTVKGFGEADYVNGGEESDTLYGGDGNDVVIGQDGDVLYGGVGADELYSGPGMDVLRGGAGAPGGGPDGTGWDFYYLNSEFGQWGKDSIIEETPRVGIPQTSNLVFVRHPSRVSITVNMVSSSERWEIRTATGTNTANWSGNAVDMVRLFSSADDKVYGNNSANTITSVRGADEVDAAGGSDSVDVHENSENEFYGTDVVDCGSGYDTVVRDPGDTALNCEVEKLSP